MAFNAFHSSVLRDGRWVTETVNLEAALKASAPSKPNPESHVVRPACGVLSRTVIESPVVRWILPVRLRSKTHSDVAFIGKTFVQISELRQDGHVYPVLRKNDFGVRIRNAVILSDGFQSSKKGRASDTLVKTETGTPTPDSSAHLGSSAKTTLPPQILVLVLESRDLVFLFLRDGPDGSPEFVTVTCEGQRGTAHLGFHLAINPSGRCLVAASPNGLFVVYELESLCTLNAQYAERGTFNPIKSVRARTIQGIINNLTFLYPRPGDDKNIILLLLMTRNEENHETPISRMTTFDWELGDDLESTFAAEPNMSRLPDEYQLTMHLIPLTVQSAFILVSQDTVIIVKNLVSGFPEYQSLEGSLPRHTRLHLSSTPALWAAWARPYRREDYFAKNDIIYLAREDGAVVYLEVDLAARLAVANVVNLDIYVDTAFAATYDRFSDVLIVGGDSGPGGVWKLHPREELAKVSTIPNWSPCVDMIALDEPSVWRAGSAEAAAAGARKAVSNGIFRKPDRVFSASGRGDKGSVTEWRWGVEAHIGLDIDSGELASQSWVFTVDSDTGQSLYALLALPHSSMLLSFADDLGQVEEVGHTLFDTSSRTLHAIQTSGDMIIQVTETSVTLGNVLERSRFFHEDIVGLPHTEADQAFCKDDTVVLAAHDGEASQVHVLQVDQMEISHISSWASRGEVTSLSVFRVHDSTFVVVASVMDTTTWISVYSSHGKEIAATRIDPLGTTSDGDVSETSLGIDPFTSICVVHEVEESVNFIVGTRCGRLITVQVSETGPKHITWTAETIGIAPVDVFPASTAINGGPGAFACCDNNLIMLSDFSQSANKFKSKETVLGTDSNNTAATSPPIHWAFSFEKGLSEHAGHLSIMLLAGSRMLLADIWPHVRPVPRSIAVGGTPNRIIFSRAWNCLVVAVVRDGKPSLDFIEPETGAIISESCSRDRRPMEFIKGLGHEEDRIFGLYEWLFIKDGRTFCFFLVSTKQGHLVIVSVEQIETQTEEGPTRTLRYWTRYKKHLGGPIFSIVGDADGLIYCVNTTIYWDVLDLVDKKLKPVKKFELDSPATSLRVVKGKILALTTMHSLEVIDHRGDWGAGEMKLVHADSISRSTVHMVEAGESVSGLDGEPVTLLSDMTGGIAGVWIPWERPDKDLVVAFTAQLPVPVRRFIRGRTRPLWLTADRQGRYGVLPTSADGSEILGVSVDGSLQHFALIGVELWRFLSLIQNAAQRSPTVYPFTYEAEAEDDEAPGGEVEPQLHHRAMHIDGDMLKRCVERRALEELVGQGRRLELFCEYLDGLEEGRWTGELRDMIGGSKERQERYFELGYQVLEHLVASPM